MKTVHSIAADVARHLERPGVLNKISRLHNLLHSWMKKSEDFDGHGFRLRPETTLGVNTSSIEKGQWIVDLKLYGVVYGHVDFSSPGEPRFTLKKVNAKKIAAHIDTIAKSDAAIAHLRTGSLDWRNPAVRRYIRAARSLASGTFDGGEAAIQAALITQMRHGLKGKPHALHYHQPVTFQGIPIQLPCPVAPLGEKADGENWGHMDVLISSPWQGDECGATARLRVEAAPRQRRAGCSRTVHTLRRRASVSTRTRRHAVAVFECSSARPDTAAHQDHGGRLCPRIREGGRPTRPD